jgi:hypothetical protein
MSSRKRLHYNKIMIILFQKFFLFDFENAQGDNILQVWADNMPMQKKDRGRLDSKIDMLAKSGDNLPPKLLQPTKSKHIMEIAVNGPVALRVMLCRGPFNMKNEFTFLYGATEKNRKHVPRDAPERANGHRDDLLLNPNRRRKHERFGQTSQTRV